jgi:phosphate transport system protein
MKGHVKMTSAENESSGEDKGHKHIVRAFDEDLENISAMTLRLGRLAARHIGRAVLTVLDRNVGEAQKVIEDDNPIDELTKQIQDLSFKTIALRQPTSIDLRMIVTAQKVSTYLERIGDYATNIAKRAIQLDKMVPMRHVHSITHLSSHVERLVRGAMEAYENNDEEMALAVWFSDEKIDTLYASLLRENLTYMMEDPGSITACTHILFIIRNLERIGDHAANISENVYFQITGEFPTGERPKPDWEETAAD